MRGFWKRPVSRMYSYNLEVGEHYYSPMTSYLEAERGTRGETPGALTYSERLARRWIHGRRYEASDIRDRYARSSSVARADASAASSGNVSYLESEMAARSARAASEMRTSSTSSRMALRQQMEQERLQRQQMQQQKVSVQQQTTQQTSQQEQRKALLSSSMQSSTSQTQQVKQESRSRQQTQAARVEATSYAASYSKAQAESKVRIEDDICKRVADIRMQPWSEGQELSEAQAASARARARIMELERELEEITRKAMTSQTIALKTAKQMAAEASLEDEASVAASTKKSRKVMIESSSKMVA